MVRGLRKKLGDWLRGGIENQPLEQVIRALQADSAPRRVRAFREMGARAHRGADEILEQGLKDPVPGVRRAAGWALGWREDSWAGVSLLRAARSERCDAPRWTMAVAAVRCGVGVLEAWSVVEAAARRQLHTFSGPRAPGPLAGVGVSDMDLLWTAALSPGSANPRELLPVDKEAARVGARARVSEDPEDRQALLDLAVFEHPDDLDLLLNAMGSQGRRMRHTAAAAIGLNGDPRGYSALLDVLRAIDVDPGHGFAGRAAAAKALGRLGLPEAARPLATAMRDEALDHEGRPGAGLGIQRPVRASMLHALGEVGEGSKGRLVAGYLGNTSGTSTGGFYLPAMDALVKLEAVDAAAELLGSTEVVAANALGVLGALGQSERIQGCLDDPRPAVAAVAAALLATD